MLAGRSQNTKELEVTGREDQTGLLRNSDRIKIKFGSYGIDIIENDNNIRVSSLYSLHHGQKINRTIAVVAYPDVIEAAFVREHEAIINGQSIGVVFEQHGWAIYKQHQFIGEFKIPAECIGNHWLFGTGTVPPAIHSYSLVVSKNGSSFNYAMIAEVHHPDFLRLKDLQTIYTQGCDKHQAQTRKTQDFLDIVKSKLSGL